MICKTDKHRATNLWPPIGENNFKIAGKLNSTIKTKKINSNIIKT